VRTELVSRGLAETSADVCLSAFEDVGAFTALVSADPLGAEAIRNIDDIRSLVEATPASGHVHFTPRLARGLSYYTGAIMEVSVSDLAGSSAGRAATA
jgi:histidyl-tRNA synthetase